MENSSVFARRLKETRQKKNFTQKALAEKIGITAATLSSYEAIEDSKRKSPTIENAASIARVLNVSLDWLCGLSEEDSTFQYDCPDKPLSYYLQKLVELKPIIKNVIPRTLSFGEATFAISSEKAEEFIESWKKILDLYRNGSITVEMCDEWTKGALSKYEHLYVHGVDSIDDKPESDKDLPF